MPGGGSKPGERRGGRQKGTPNKITNDVRALAQQYAPDAIRELGRLAREAQSEAARVAAANSILDRAYGKPHQTAHVELRRDVREMSDAELYAIAGGTRAAGETDGEEEHGSVH